LALTPAQRRTPTTRQCTLNYEEPIKFPNEYFHTVLIETVWHPDGGVLQEEVVDAEDCTLLGGAKPCMQGTGFFYRLNGRNFLVTARHCFTNRAWRTDEYLDPPVPCVTPTHVRMRLRLKPKSEEFDANHLLSVEFCLRLVDEDQNPLWFEHPRGAQVDIAARPLDDLPSTNYISCHWNPKTRPTEPSRVSG
jgi:hypothetical protein